MIRGLIKMASHVVLPSGDKLLMKSSFEVQDKLEAFYAGGQIAFSEDDGHMFCSCGSSLTVVSMETGRTVIRIEEEDDALTSLAVSGDGKFLVSGWRSLLVRQYDWKEETCTRQWKAHLAPTVCMHFDPTSTLLATGASNSTIKVWDCYKQYCTHSFKGCGGVVNLVQFHPTSLTLVSAAADCKIRLWDLKASKCTRVLAGHFSAVTGVTFTTDERFLISCGRDQVLLLWDIEKARTVKTVPVFESLEGVSLLPVGVTIPTSDGEVIMASSANICCATAGEKGHVKIWDMHSGKCLHTLPPPVETPPKQSGHHGNGSEEAGEENPNAFMWLHLRSTLGALVGVTAEHNIVVYSLKTLSVTKQFVGYSDEVLDMRFLGDQEQYLAVATNSALVKVFQRQDLSCQLLSGHSAVVLCLDCSADGRTMVTGSKDNTVRLWQLAEDGHFSCVAVGHGHTHSVGAVAFSRTKTSFVVSGAADQTMKMWSMRSLKKTNQEGDPVSLPVRFTKLVHDKDINSVSVSPNDTLVVTGSQDRTAKLWSTADGSHLGTMRGHRRGVWCVVFSSVDQCVATSSADCTIKLWAVEDCSCVKTFEGHETSVLKVTFATRGMQLVSSGNDGLVKVWTIRTNECATTLDGHSDKVWCLACTKDETLLVSGGADSRICFWKDVTEQVQEENRARQEELVVREQELSNLLDQGRHSDAVGLAIALDHPKRVLTILNSLLEEEEEEEGFRDTVAALREDQITVLLQYIKKWNTNAKFSRVAQSALAVLFRTHSPTELTQLAGMKQVVEGLIPYTERHLQRLSRLQQLSAFVEYTWDCMKLPTLSEEMVSVDTNRRTEEAKGSVAQQATSGQVTPSLTEASVGIVARDVLAESHDCHMDQSDGSDNDSSAKSPEVLVCAAADSTTPEEGPGLWIEDRQPTEVEGIEEHEEEEEEEEGGRQEERGKRHKGGKDVEKTSSTPATLQGRKRRPRVRPLLAAFTPRSAKRTQKLTHRFKKLQRSV